MICKSKDCNNESNKEIDFVKGYCRSCWEQWQDEPCKGGLIE